MRMSIKAIYISMTLSSRPLFFGFTQLLFLGFDKMTLWSHATVLGRMYRHSVSLRHTYLAEEFPSFTVVSGMRWLEIKKGYWRFSLVLWILKPFLACSSLLFMSSDQLSGTKSKQLSILERSIIDTNWVSEQFYAGLANRMIWDLILEQSAIINRLLGDSKRLMLSSSFWSISAPDNPYP